MRLIKQKRLSHKRRRGRVRLKISGTGVRPRLAVFRSLKHIYVQLINDELGETVAEASTLSPELKENLTNGGNIAAAENVGTLIAGKRRSSKELKRSSLIGVDTFIMGVSKPLQKQRERVA